MDGSCDLKIVKTHANNSKEVIMRSLRGHKRSEGGQRSNFQNAPSDQKINRNDPCDFLDK